MLCKVKVEVLLNYSIKKSAFSLKDVDIIKLMCIISCNLMPVVVVS